MGGDKPHNMSTVMGPRDEGPGGYVGPYKLVGRLGEGGFGIVYEAEQALPVRRRVALKVIKPGMDSREVVARFESERQALARMEHPHVAKVFDAGTSDDGRPYFVMELVKGDPITSYCDEQKLDIAGRLALFVQVCEAVHHAHANGIIHRDLKPANILVSSHDDRPYAKVIDFGIAKAITGRLGDHSVYTQQGMLVGTPLYMSPEQVEGASDIDLRTDIYALGVVLYELLTGTTPFTGDTLRSAGHVELQRIIREVEPPSPSSRLTGSGLALSGAASRRSMEPRSLARTVRGELDWIAMKAIDKNRRRRYDSASALAADVRRYLAGERVHAAPPGLLYGVGKFLRRRGQMLAVTSVIVALGTGLAWTMLQQRPDPTGAGKSIAVLPFANLSTSAEDAFLALGFHDEVLTDLARIADMRVISRTSVMPYRDTDKSLAQIADELGVAMVLDGTVQRSGDRVRIQVSLNDPASNAVVWTERFDTELSSASLSGIQARITRAVAANLGSELSAAEGRSIDAMPTRSTPAYEAFLRGKALSRYGENSQADLLAAAAAFEAAIAADPTFAAAYSAKAIVHMALLWSGHERDRNIVAARVALDAASRIAPDSAETLIALGYYHYWGFYDYARAEAAVARAVAASPNNADAWLLRASIARRDLRFKDAIAAFQRCIDLDPLRPGNAIDTAYAMALSGDLAGAREAAAHARAQAPDAPYVVGNYIAIAVLAGDLEDAWRAARDLPTLDSGAYDHVRTTLALYSRDPAKLRPLLATWPAPRQEPPFHNHFDLMRAFALHQMGDVAEAQAVLAPLRARVAAALEQDPRDDENRKIIIAAHALAGDLEGLRASHAAMIANPPKDKLWAAEEGFVVVVGLALAGEADAAFDLLAEVMDRAGDANFERARASPAFDALRRHPRYLSLQARHQAVKAPVAP